MAINVPTDPAALAKLVLSLAALGLVVILASRGVGYTMRRAKI